MSEAEPAQGAPKLTVVRPPITRFDEKVLKLRSEWAVHDVAPGYVWRRTSQNEGSDSRPFNVFDDKTGQTGKAKPGDIGLSDIARAGHEKIVSDLAAVLDLPVPPVTLYDRGDAAKGDRLNDRGEKVDSPRHIAVSAWAFRSCDALSQRYGTLTQEQKQSLVTPFSAMSVFETWISAGNPHMSHVMIDNDLGDRPGVAWIDHAFSLSYAWEQNQQAAVAWYLSDFSPDKDVQMATAEKIAVVGDVQIRNIVDRIKPEWLSLVRRDLIIAKLIERREALLQLCSLK